MFCGQAKRALHEMALTVTIINISEHYKIHMRLDQVNYNKNSTSTYGVEFSTVDNLCITCAYTGKNF